MTFNVETSEPVVVLNGTTVLQAVYDLVCKLLASGHNISVDEDGLVVVTPDVHADTRFVLASNSRDTEAVLTFWGPDGTVQ